MSRTAFTSGQQATLLQQPHALIGLGLAVHTPAIIWRGTITSHPAFPADGTGIGQVTVTTTAGSFADVIPGMTVVIGAASPLSYGTRYYTYARKAPGATTLYIDGFGEGTFDITGTAFQVLDDYRPFPRRHRYNSGAWYMNFDEAYTNQNENFGPQAVFGCSAVIYKNGSVNFEYDGTRSIAHTPGSTITDWNWTFPDGTTATGSTATWTTSTAYPNGGWTHLEVIDDNGDSHTGHRLAFKFDSDNPPYILTESVSLEEEWTAGCKAEIMMNDPLWGYSTAHAVNNHCVLFGNTAYGATVEDIGGNFPDRENIWLDGWMVNDETTTTVDGMMHTYTIATVDAMCQQYGFPLTMDDTSGSPASWLEMKDLTLDLIGWHFCRWRSTIGDVVDVTFAGTDATTRVKKYMDIEGATMWNQLQQIYSWIIDGTVSSDPQSGIYCEQSALTNATVAAAAPVMLTLITNTSGGTGTGFRRTYLREGFTQSVLPPYLYQTAKFTAYGVDYATPVGSRAPDDPIAHGVNLDEIPAGLAHTQAEMNTFSGRHRSVVDALKYSQTFPMAGIIRITATPQSFVQLDLSETSSVVRGVSYTFDLEHDMCYTTFACQSVITIFPAGIEIDFTSI